VGSYEAKLPDIEVAQALPKDHDYDALRHLVDSVTEKRDFQPFLFCEQVREVYEKDILNTARWFQDYEVAKSRLEMEPNDFDRRIAKIIRKHFPQHPELTNWEI
jgi:hypothetical protein